MKKIYTLKLLLTIGVFWAPWLILGQNIQGLSSFNLPKSAQVKGLYQIQGDDASGKYLKEENDVLTLASMVETDESFYFWIVENIENNTFQIYSAKQKGKLVAIDTDGTAAMVTDRTLKTTELVFRIRSRGPERTNKNPKIVAKGYISTLALKNYALSECQCNKITSGNGRFIVQRTEIDEDAFNVALSPILNTSEAVGNSPQEVVQEKAATVEDLALSIYPNPASNIVNFKLNTQGEGQANIYLYDITGKPVIMATEILNGNAILKGQINIKSLPLGMYILKLQLPDGTSVNKKILKK